jgi:hypothetical protein
MHRSASRFSIRALAVAALAAAACASRPALAPDAATAPPSATAEGVTVTVIPERWRYSPRGLPDQVTPVRVRITNGRAQAILVNLTDARLVPDETLKSARAPSARETSGASLVAEGGIARAAVSPADAVQLVAKAGGSHAAGGGSGVALSRRVGIGGIGIELGGLAVGGPGWGVGTSGVPIGRGGVAGDADEGALDPLHVGIKPGRLDPGTSVEGYVFFEKPLTRADRDRRFWIAWRFPPLAAPGAAPAPVATVQVPIVAR